MKLIHEFTNQLRNPNFDLSYLKLHCVNEENGTTIFFNQKLPKVDVEIYLSNNRYFFNNK